MTNQLARLGAFRFTLLAALAILTPRAGTAQATSYQVIRSFRGDPDGAQPMGAVVIGKDGALYGTTELGGTSKTGTVFKLAPVTATSWKETVLHSFTGPPDGLYPQATLAFGEGGLYGTTRGGGTGGGTIFEMAPPSAAGGAWTETVLYAFVYGGFGSHTQDVIPNGEVLIGPRGTIYATTQGTGTGPDGLVGVGTAVALAPPATPGGDWTEDILYTFGFNPGYFPPRGRSIRGRIVVRHGHLRRR